MLRPLIFISFLTVPQLLSAQETTSLSVDWQEAQTAFSQVENTHKSDVTRFRSSAPEDLSNTNLPVLLPVFGAKRSSGNFFSSGDTYGSFFTLAGVQASITGTIVAMVVEDESAVFEESEEVIIDFSEDGIEGSFFRYGASYNVRISCDNLEDDRCTDDKFISEVISGLEVLGGREIR
ncbi:MAG: hypothetical protein AAFQ87_19330 [Bacteroidota bacterium]